MIWGLFVGEGPDITVGDREGVNAEVATEVIFGGCVLVWLAVGIGVRVG